MNFPIAHTIRRPALVLADTRLMAARLLFTPAGRRQLGMLLRRAAGGGKLKN